MGDTLPASPGPLVWAYLGAGLTLVAILIAFGAALVLYQRRFLRLHRTYADGLLHTQEEERAWVAREVHDDALQRIVMLLHELDDWASAENGSEAGRRYRTLRAELEDLSTVLRTMAYRLHPSFLEADGMMAALQRLATDLTRNTRIRVDVIQEGEPLNLTPEQGLAAYRIVQEALTNAVRHGDTDIAEVRVWVAAGALELTVIDRGRGFEPEPARAAGGLGLVSMAERARAAGGVLSIESQPGTGTTVGFHLPLVAGAA